MQQKKWTRPVLERLEEREVPATFNISNLNGTLTLTQTASTLGTTLNITDDPGAGTITIEDNVGPNTFPVGASTNLVLNYLSTDTNATYNYTLTGTRTGNATLNVNNTSTRALNINSGGGVGGNLTVVGGPATITVSETVGPLLVGGNASVIGGNAADTLSLGIAGTTIGGSLTTTKMNTVTLTASDIVGTNFTFNNSSEFNDNALTLTDATVGGLLNYIGGSRNDVISLGGAATIGGSLIVNFSTQLAAGVSSLTIGAAGGASVVGGSLSVTGGNLGAETVTLGAAATLAGSATLNLGTALGTGTNTVSFLGLFTGASFNYTGGAGVDSITYTPAAGSGRARFTASLGAGIDSVTFGAGATNPSFAFIDFGAGVDTLAGTINFPFTFLNLP